MMDIPNHANDGTGKSGGNPFLHGLNNKKARRSVLFCSSAKTRFPLPSPLPQAGEGDKESLRELHFICCRCYRRYVHDLARSCLQDDATGRGWPGRGVVRCRRNGVSLQHRRCCQRHYVGHCCRNGCAIVLRGVRRPDGRGGCPVQCDVRNHLACHAGRKTVHAA